MDCPTDVWKNVVQARVTGSYGPYSHSFAFCCMFQRISQFPGKLDPSFSHPRPRPVSLPLHLTLHDGQGRKYRLRRCHDEIYMFRLELKSAEVTCWPAKSMFR